MISVRLPVDKTSKLLHAHDRSVGLRDGSAGSGEDVVLAVAEHHLTRDDRVVVAAQVPERLPGWMRGAAVEFDDQVPLPIADVAVPGPTPWGRLARVPLARGQPVSTLDIPDVSALER